MNVIETMKQAMEWIEAQHEPRMIGAAKVITALRAAIEQAEKQEPVVFKQFLADVHTAAGLLSHGKKDKGLAERLSLQVMDYYTRPAPAVSVGEK